MNALGIVGPSWPHVPVNIDMRKERNMHMEQKTEMRNLAQARAWIDANHRQKNELADGERQRRVVEYTRQVEEHGCITEFLPPPDQRGMRRRRMPVRNPQWRGFAY